MEYNVKEIVLRTKNKWNSTIVDLPEEVKIVDTVFELTHLPDATIRTKRFRDIDELREAINRHGKYHELDYRQILIYLEPVENGET